MKQTFDMKNAMLALRVKESKGKEATYFISEVDQENFFNTKLLLDEDILLPPGSKEEIFLILDYLMDTQTILPINKKRFRSLRHPLFSIIPDIEKRKEFYRNVKAYSDDHFFYEIVGADIRKAILDKGVRNPIRVNLTDSKKLTIVK